MILNDHDQRILNGDSGEGARMAMSILTRMAEVCGAEELLEVTAAHIDGCGLLSDASLEFAERLAAGGARVSVPTTLNMGPLDLQNWQHFGVDAHFAGRAIRQADAYTKMGCIPTWTCAPYQGYLTPRFGQQIAWGESNAVVYANSVLGARTNRYADYMDICAGITGRVPKHGLHLTANRRGQLLVRLPEMAAAYWQDESAYAALGHLLGPLAGDKVPVLEGLPTNTTDDQFKALGAAAASSGAVALFHAVGVTPEAPTLDDALHGEPPERIIDVTHDQLAAARADLSSAADGDPLDLVVLGCPHFSFAEFRRLADLFQSHGNRKIHPNVSLVVISSQTANALIQRTDLPARLAEVGVQITLDTCVFHTPMVPRETKVLMTNSGKCAYYAPGELDVTVAFGTMAECVRSAIAGRVCREEL